MPLSEHEQNLFDQIERSLLEDPKFADAARPLKWWQLRKRLMRFLRRRGRALRHWRLFRVLATTYANIRQARRAKSMIRGRWILAYWVFRFISDLVAMALIVLGVWKALELVGWIS